MSKIIKREKKVSAVNREPPENCRIFKREAHERINVTVQIRILANWLRNS